MREPKLDSVFPGYRNGVIPLTQGKVSRAGSVISPDISGFNIPLELASKGLETQIFR